MNIDHRVWNFSRKILLLQSIRSN